MTEEDWIKSTDPRKMLEVFRDNLRYRRKLRLFAIACCYRILRFLDESGRRAIETAERFADGNGNQDDIKFWDHYWDVIHPAMQLGGTDFRTYAAHAAESALWPGKDVVAAQTAMEMAHKAIVAATAEYDCLPPKGRRSRERAYRGSWAALLRCLFGNPFQPLRSLPNDAALRAWHDGLLVSMAQQMYDARDFADMPILADALEEAGCDNAEILNHCRQPGEHVRGCWVVDLLLNKS